MADADSLYDLIIIGAGPSGMFSAFYAGLREMKTLIIEALPSPGGQLAVLYPEKFIYDVPGFPRVLAKDLVKHLWDQANKFKPEAHFDEKALKIQSQGNETILVQTTKGQYLTRTIVVSAGIGAFSPNKLDLPGVADYENKGIYYHVDDKTLFRGKKLLIVGGGDSAVDWALTMKDWAKEVTLIHRRDEFRAHEGSLAEMMASPKITKHIWWELKSVQADGNKVTGAVIFNNKTGEEEVLSVDIILLNLGFKADLGIIGEWGLELNKRSIVVNNMMATNLPGVFAVGDIAEPTGRVQLHLIIVGFAQAAIAVNAAKNYIDPKSRIFPGHSSELRL
jgi:ferredoxin/flavodoxin---NADP+ reductase